MTGNIINCKLSHKTVEILRYNMFIDLIVWNHGVGVRSMSSTSILIMDYV